MGGGWPGFTGKRNARLFEVKVLKDFAIYVLQSTVHHGKHMGWDVEISLVYHSAIYTFLNYTARPYVPSSIRKPVDP